MKGVYTCVFTPLQEGGYMVYSPDFDCNTQGETLDEAIYMARDAIALVGITYEDMGKELPTPMNFKDVEHSESDIVSFVDVDFTAYRRANERRTVRKNVTIPSWLNVEAERAGVNFSQILQDALRLQLGYE